MEDRGYLVAHPTLIDPKGHAPAEQQHITHKVKDLKLYPNVPFDKDVLFFLPYVIISICLLMTGATGG